MAKPKNAKSQKTAATSGSQSAPADNAATSLPFEPVSTKKKVPKTAPATSAKGSHQSQGARSPINSKTMPKVVGDRMARRMAFFCGIPSVFGMLTFVVSYWLVNHGYKLPNVAVVLVSMLFFGIGVIGLSYGVISACWDEEREGTRLGWGEFKTNFGRLTAAFRESRAMSKSE